jgi:DNA-binding transcriptional MocR family regulator
LTNGASYGAANILQQYTLPHTGYTRQAFIVSPTYFLINSVFLDAGFSGKLTAVREDPKTGLDFDFLEQELQKHDAAAGLERKDDASAIEDPTRDRPRKLFRYVIYLVPTFSNPSGSTMSIASRLRLLDVARKHNMLILCDDVYDFLAFPDTNVADIPPRIVTLDRATLSESGVDVSKEYGNSVSNLTFSKLLGPGLRVGWQETVSPLLAQGLAQSGAVRSGGTPSQLNSMIVGEMIRLNRVHDPIISNLVKTYGARAHALREAIAAELPQGTEVYGGEGGYFLWVVTPEIVDARAAEKLCKERGVILPNGDHFEVEGHPLGWGRRCQRLAISFLTEDQIRLGIKIWGQVCKELIQQQEKKN